jgi:hypothetical protein
MKICPEYQLNECINAANDMLRSSDPIKAKLVEVLILKAFALGEQSAKGKMVDFAGGNR